MQHRRNAATLVRQSARRIYANSGFDTRAIDGWNEYKYKRTEQFILRSGSSILCKSRATLDAGAGERVYDWMPSNRISLDRYLVQISKKRWAIVADLELLPFPDKSFDLAFCIGSAINYVSAAEALNELARVIVPGGHLFLHFETSTSFEQLFKPAWGASAHLNRTVNASHTDLVWIYSPKYIRNLLKGLQFRVLSEDRFHIFSSLCSRLGMPQQHAHKFSQLDHFSLFLKSFADDVVILAERT